MNSSDHASPAASTLHAQIYARFRALIEAGQLKPGQRVSSLRALAEELGVARGTVQAAYDRLLGEGYLVARGPAGTFVAEHAAPTPRRAPARKTAGPRGAARQTRPPGAGGPIIDAGGDAPALLQLGVPALDEFPRKLWSRLLAREARRAHTLTKPAPAGYRPLREALAAYLHRSRGFALQPEQVFVVPAYTAGLALAVDALSLAGNGHHDDTPRTTGNGAWVENPGYPPTAQLLARLGLCPQYVPVDEHGLDVEFGAKHFAHAKLAVVTPSHQSPTGVALSLPRRVALLDWATKQRAWIFEDDYDGEYRYRGHPLPALKSLDTSERVIYCGTLSKVMFPALRLAYLAVPSTRVEAFDAASARAVHGGCPELMQAAVAEFINGGHFSRHIKRMRTLYAQRRAMLAAALRPHEPRGFAVRLQDGGMHLLLDVPANRDDAEMARLLREAGFGVHALTTWQRGRAGRRALILGFTNVASEGDAKRLVAKLMRVVGESSPQE
ncbi:MAG TPA: PLP-dependent aminotransferase family protein [Paraburkholderia sp.]|jgi:GntR family transcriptional regulator/MocR family aminotransferase|nr:PLP-dependent aminotransferase family protein [Paraburkholderia sp.]